MWQRIIVVVIAILFVGCAGVKYSKVADAPVMPSEGEILVLTEPPDRPHKVIGLMTVKRSSKTAQKLVEKAREMGANAIILGQITDQKVSNIQIHHMNATAIIWTDGSIGH